jgi:hypothetical protein
LRWTGGDATRLPARGACVRDASGLVERVAGSQTDITLRKRYERKLEIAAEKQKVNQLREELSEAQGRLALAAALGPAIAVERSLLHEITAMRFKHDEEVKEHVARYDSIITKAECSTRAMQTELSKHM